MENNIKNFFIFKKMDNVFDIIIIGCGFNGLMSLDFFSTKYKCLIIEKNSTFLSYIKNFDDSIVFVSQSKKWNLPIKHMSIKNIVKYFEKNIVEKHQKNILYNINCKRIIDDGVKKIIDCGDKKFYTKFVIISTGSNIPKKMSYPIDFNYITKFENKNILLFGSGTSAADFANLNIKDNQILWVRKSSNKIHKTKNTKQIKDIQILKNEYITFEENKYMYKKEKLNYDIVVSLIGFELDKNFFIDNNIELYENKEFLKTNNYFETNRKGIFAIGPLTSQNIKLNYPSYIEHNKSINILIEKKIKEYSSQ